MKILAFDTTTKFLSIAVLSDRKLLCRFHEEIGPEHASKLIPTIKAILEENSLKIKDIDAIAVSIGPGSFAGLRIGVATAKSMALALGIKLVAVPTLDVIAANFRSHKGRIAPLLDAKKNKVYSAIYESDGHALKKLTEDLLLSADELLYRLNSPTLFFGDGVDLYGYYMRKKSPLVSLSEKGDWYPRAEVVAKTGLEKLKAGYRNNIDTLVPVYLHSKECQIMDRPRRSPVTYEVGPMRSGRSK